MYSVEVYLAVRQFVFVEGHSRKEAARVFGLNHGTVQKMCAHPKPPGYRRPTYPQHRLGPYIEVINSILREDEAAPPKQRHTVRRLVGRLQAEHGYTDFRKTPARGPEVQGLDGLVGGARGRYPLDVCISNFVLQESFCEYDVPMRFDLLEHAPRFRGGRCEISDRPGLRVGEFRPEIAEQQPFEVRMSLWIKSRHGTDGRSTSALPLLGTRGLRPLCARRQHAQPKLKIRLR